MRDREQGTNHLADHQLKLSTEQTTLVERRTRKYVLDPTDQSSFCARRVEEPADNEYRRRERRFQGKASSR